MSCAGTVGLGALASPFAPVNRVGDSPISGIEGPQLLAKVVNVEKPELEAQKQQLQSEFNQYQIDLLELENDLLERLSNAPDDILSDIPLIEGLEATKKASKEIEAAVKLGKETEVAINIAREVYRPVASEASMMYFICTQLCSIDHMYQYSLLAFTTFFFKSIDKAEKSDDDKVRIKALRDSMRFIIFNWVCRGLAEKHKIVYMGQIALKLMTRGDTEEEYIPEHFQFFLRAPKILGDECPVEWMSQQAWMSVNALAEIEEFAKLPSDIVDASPRFMEWYNHEKPEGEKLPLDWSQLDKTPFQKILVPLWAPAQNSRCWRTQCLKKMGPCMPSFNVVTRPLRFAPSPSTSTCNSAL